MLRAEQCEQRRNPRRIFHPGSAHKPVKLNTVIGGNQPELKLTVIDIGDAPIEK